MWFLFFYVVFVFMKSVPYALSVAGPSWNSLPDNLRALVVSRDSFRVCRRRFVCDVLTHAAH